VKQLRRDDDVIAYDQIGEGPDLVWLASGDLPGESWHTYQVPAFSTTHRNTTYDARGVGSTRVSQPPPWSMDDHARDCVDIIRAVCDPPVTLIGLSLGSAIAQKICLDHPELVRCAILMGTCAERVGFIRFWETAEVEFHRGGGTLSSEFAIAHYAALLYPAEVLGSVELWEKVKPMLVEAYGRRDSGDLAAQWGGLLEFSSVDALPSCEVPIHVIAFSEDLQTPPALGKKVADLAARGHYHLLRGLGHGSLFGHRPDVVNHCIREIINA